MAARRFPDQLRPYLDPVVASVRTVAGRVANRGSASACCSSST
ncbi:hypothetical protein [Nocardioides zeae]